MSEPLVFQLQQLRLVQGEKVLCAGVDLQIRHGEVWGLLGANGSGKTTLLHALAGLRPPVSGQIHVLQRPVHNWPRRELATRLGILLQDQPFTFPARVKEWAMHGRHPHQSAWQLDSIADQQLVNGVLEQVDLLPLAERRIDQLSGGERQRLAIATLLLQAAPNLLLDEPTNHLDLHYQVSLMQLLIQHSRQLQGAVVASLHDLNLATRFCTHLLLLLGEGEVVAGPIEDMLTEHYLHRLYKHCIIKIENHNGRAFLPG